MRISYRPNKAGLDQLLHAQQGPVQLHVANKGREVEGAARRRVGVKTGKLKASIGSRMVRSARGFNTEVFASAPYAKYHHDGTRPHVIRGNPLLVFPGRDGFIVFTTHVNHPGTKAVPFLLDALRDAGLDVGRRSTR